MVLDKKELAMKKAERREKLKAKKEIRDKKKQERERRKREKGCLDHAGEIASSAGIWRKQRK